MIYLAFLIWRSLLFIWSYFISYTQPFFPSFPYYRQLLINSWLPVSDWSWGNFDGVHYLSIARNFYAANFTQAFFPLYPMVVRLIAGVFNDKWMILSGLAVSNISFLLAGKYFLELLQLDFDKKIVWRSLIWLLIFPFSFFFAAIYSESLFFLLLMLAFFTARKKSWWWSGFWGILVTATRLTGILLWPALLWEYFCSMPVKLSAKRKIVKTVLSPVFFLVPLGTVSYMMFLYLKFGDAFLFWHAQSAFGVQRSSGAVIFPLVTIWRYIKIFLTASWTQPNFWIAVMEFSAFIFSLVIIYLGYKKKMRASYLLFAGLLITLPVISGTLSSFPRYLLPVFIIYPVLAHIKNKLLLGFLYFVSLALLIFFSGRFLQGLWVA